MGEARDLEGLVSGSPDRFELIAWHPYRVRAGITTRASGGLEADFALGSVPPTAEVTDRLERLAGDLEAKALVVSKQVHGIGLAWHQGLTGVSVLEGLDGHGTRDPDLVLAVTVADCVPVYLFDPMTRAAALLHAGWRGIAAGVLAAGIEMLTVSADVRVENLVMHCGPCICGHCYEVGHEVKEALGEPTEGSSGPWRADLRGVLRRQGQALGLRRITLSSLCTREASQAFFSHRGSGGRTGRMVAYLRVLP